MHSGNFIVYPLTTYLICCSLPPEVALVIAHAASFLVLYSALQSTSTNDGIIFASITAYRKKMLQETFYTHNNHYITTVLSLCVTTFLTDKVARGNKRIKITAWLPAKFFQDICALHINFTSCSNILKLKSYLLMFKTLKSYRKIWIYWVTRLHLAKYFARN